MTCRSRTTKLTLLAGLVIPLVLATSSLQEVSAVTTISQLGTDIDGEAGVDLSGTSVAMSTDGTRIAIGAPGNDNNNGSDAGHVRVYDWDGTAWTQIGGDINGRASGDEFGFSVAMSSNGNRIAIGAPGNDGNGFDSGYVRVSTLDPGASGDEFGYSVAMSSNGNRIAIGAPFTDDGQFDLDLGTVRVYELSGNTWTQIGGDIDGEAAGDQSGRSVSMSSDGTRLAIGAPTNGDNASLIGHVRVYELTGSAWVQVGIDIDGEAAGDRSGTSVAMSSDGTRIAIGAPENDGNTANSDRGHVRVHQLLDLTPAPVPVWRVDLDPNGGTCHDGSTRNEPWVSVFVGYRYLPSATDCTRPGHVFAGWADAATPSVVRSFPLLSDPSDNERRYFIAENLDLIAVWTPVPTPEAITNLQVFANFLCGPCTTVWLIHEPVDVDVSITVDETNATCNQTGTVFGLTVCELTNLTPGNRTVTVTPMHGKPTSVTFTLRG